MNSQIKSSLQKLPGILDVSDVDIENDIIKRIVVRSTNLGELVISVIEEDSDKLFNFYFQGLSEQDRIFFCPYPLFNPRPTSPQELSNIIRDWKKEKDWTVLKLMKNNEIIGICLLKRFKTKSPTSGLAVHQHYQKKGLGLLLQTVINEQAKLLNLKKLAITLAPENKASLRVHEKAGYTKTGRMVPHYTYHKGVKIIDRDDIEMSKELTK